MRSQPSHAYGRVGSESEGGYASWLHQIVQENVLSSPSVEENEFSRVEPSQASDMLAFAMGQRLIWQQGFQSSVHDGGNFPFNEAPLTARAHLKLAFMHAADQLMLPQSNRTKLI